MERGTYHVACPKLEEASRLSPGAGIIYNLADCFERIGKTASAWRRFFDLAMRLHEEGLTVRAEDAARRAKALQSRLTWLHLHRWWSLPNTVVELDGKPVESPRSAVDPGSYRLTVSAPGHHPWSTRVTTADAGVVHVDIPELKLLPASSPPSVHAKPPPRPRELGGERIVTTEATARPWQSPLGIIGLGVGTAAVLAAGVVGIAAKMRADRAACDDNNRCEPDGLEDRASAVAMGNVATGLLVGGAAFASAGLVVWLTAPSEEAATLQANVQPDAAFVVLTTSW